MAITPSEQRAKPSNTTPATTLIETTSRVKVWWLTKLHGYRIRSVSQTPRASLFGAIAYMRKWTLDRP